MDYDAHWQAIYTGVRGALDAAGLTTVPLMPVHSQDTQVADSPAEPPYVVYTDETDRRTGSTAGGPNKVIQSGFKFTIRAVDLDDVHEIGTAIDDYMETEAIPVTSDGYTTTAITHIGGQTLFELDSKLNAMHVRYDWERSK